MKTDAPTGPDLMQGIDSAELADGQLLLCHVGGEPVLLTRRGEDVFAVGATCTHYGGPLERGLVVGETIHCPLHHARFSLRSGEALAPPALDPIPCWSLERRAGRLYVIGRAKDSSARARTPEVSPSSIVVVGGGAAGQAAVETLRREGYAGRITMLCADTSPPCDRPNLSKDYLAGTASEDWIPLRPPGFFPEHEIELVLGARVSRVDIAERRVVVEDGRAYPFGALLLATGADPVSLTVPGSELPMVHYLRSLSDSRSIIAALDGAKCAVVVGASFIGLEVASSLRQRGLAVSVVAPGGRPLERVLGPELGDFVRALHEEHGVEFHLGQKVRAIVPGAVHLASGESLAADIVVAGIGVRPAVALAEQAGLAVDRGVLVNEYLETSAPGIFAAGDVARWRDPSTGETSRIEHWVVAERQGQLAARNMLGRRQPYRIAPYFWSQHYDVAIRYVGHAEQWDEIEVDGSLAQRHCRVSFRREGRILAVATVGRDVESLRAEAEMER
jgi:NADPH-dependent 2,4-dienoyl-CoA reductase/sulfur reductase-like enzyme/nitrite reductase/ring-hydroxylating ferredoxin subunit